MAERLDVFMARANQAYYANHDPFADFTTAPEISQMFGELIGAWLAVVWQQLGAPDPVRLIEAGPGRGTLMQDALRVLARIAPALREAARVHFVEASPRLRAEQATRVPDADWHDALEDVPAGPALLVANEFLDALPIRQFALRTEGWTERFVQDGKFVEQPANLLERSAEEGDIVELGEAGLAWIGMLADRLLRQGGAALLLDYGSAETLPGDSLQALRSGRPADPLADAGDADLTAHVDFASIARVARAAGAAVWGPVPQGAFLGQLGLAERARRLATSCPDRSGAILADARRLAAPGRMGLLFKAICLAHPDCPQPPGFVA